MKRREESGFALLLIFVLAAVVAISLYFEMPRVAFESQRAREQLSIDRANAVQARHPAFLPEVSHLSAKSRRSGDHAQHSLLAPALQGSVDGERMAAGACRSGRAADRFRDSAAQSGAEWQPEPASAVPVPGAGAQGAGAFGSSTTAAPTASSEPARYPGHRSSDRSAGESRTQHGGTPAERSRDWRRTRAARRSESSAAVSAADPGTRSSRRTAATGYPQQPGQPQDPSQQPQQPQQYPGQPGYPVPAYPGQPGQQLYPGQPGQPQYPTQPGQQPQQYPGQSRLSGHAANSRASRCSIRVNRCRKIHRSRNQPISNPLNIRGCPHSTRPAGRSISASPVAMPGIPGQPFTRTESPVFPGAPRITPAIRRNQPAPGGANQAAGLIQQILTTPRQPPSSIGNTNGVSGGMSRNRGRGRRGRRERHSRRQRPHQVQGVGVYLRHQERRDCGGAGSRATATAPAAATHRTTATAGVTAAVDASGARSDPERAAARNSADVSVGNEIRL